MKYLKTFNEAVTQDDIELCCVDLFDEGFELNGFSPFVVKTGNPIQLLKNITSSLPEDQSNMVVIDEHSKNYKQGTITISGSNFDHIATTERDQTFTENENKLISQVSNAAHLLKHYSSNKGNRDRVVIIIVNRGIQNPMNFQYERYMTQINILFYL